ncbi:SRPBCC family protein [Streptomyces sp. NPDC051907]|uniref:SRPBCC family protein n=1 Tax=Streptomyces sp. NPDC051907 TaxID=3155284 RepID=UPI00344925CC
MTYSVAVERRVEAPQEQVWRALTDLESMPRVLSGVEAVEILAHAPQGGFGVGTRWRETRKMMGKQATEEMTVTASAPPTRYVVEARSHGSHYVSEFALRPEGPDATTVRMTFSAVPTGGAAKLMAKLLGRLGARAVSKAIAGDLADVAAAVEGRQRGA